MADIIKLDTTVVNDYISGAIRRGFEFVSWADDASIILASARVETVGEYFYQVQSGDLTITDATATPATPEIRYVHIDDDGDGTASAYVDLNAGTYDPNKGGYYYGAALVLFQMLKVTGPVYSRKARLWPNWPGGEIVKARDGLTDLDEVISLKALIF